MSLFGPRLGCIADDADSRDIPFNALGLASASDTRCVLDSHGLPIVKQMGSSCVGQAFARAMALVERQYAADNGLPMPTGQPSALAAYHDARRWRRPAGPMPTGGSRIRDCVKAVRARGLPDDVLWPQTRRNLHRMPSFAAQMAGHGRRGAEFVRINSTGEARLDAIRDAICAGYPVVFRLMVGRGFGKMKTIAKPPGPEQFLGNHAMVITGYDEDEFLVDNSWGETRNDKGRLWLGPQYLLWGLTGDFTIVYGWPAIGGGS